jgi:hypothetical protein
VIAENRAFGSARELLDRVQQLNQKLGALSESTIAQISVLNPDQLEALAIALLNFTTMCDLIAWLEQIR